jgi:hypothetical protein
LATGTRRSSGDERGIVHRINNSKTVFHTHPGAAGMVGQSTAPSSSDVCKIGDNIGHEATFGLAYPTGVMIYRSPILDPDTGVVFDYDPKELMQRYYMKRGVGFSEKRKGLIQISSLSEAQKVELERQFAEQTLMIEDEALWGDQIGLERVLDKIFCTDPDKPGPINAIGKILAARF